MGRTEMSADILGIGYPGLDLIVQISKLPESGTSVPITRYLYQGGGTVSTALAAASMLGASTSILGIIGADAAGQFCLKDLELNGVDTSRLLIDQDSSTAFNICLSETEQVQRSFLSCETMCRSLTADELDLDAIAQAKWLHLARMDSVSVDAAKYAHEHGTKVMLDADLFDSRTQQYSEWIDVLIASEEYYTRRFQTGDYESNCRLICSDGPGTAMITLGARGCAGIHQGKYFEFPAFTDVPVVDTTGAGDVFHGASLYGFLQGWDIVQIVRFASAAAAIKCTCLGGRSGIPDFRTVDMFLREGKIDPVYIKRRANAYQKLSLNH